MFLNTFIFLKRHVRKSCDEAYLHSLQEAEVLEKNEGEEERLLSTCCVPKCKGGKRTASCGFPHIRKLLFSFSFPTDRDLFI